MKGGLENIVAIDLRFSFEENNKKIIDGVIGRWSKPKKQDEELSKEGLHDAFLVFHKASHCSIEDHEIFLREFFGDAENLESLREICAQINGIFSEYDYDLHECRQHLIPDEQLKEMMGQAYKKFTVNYLHEISAKLKEAYKLDYDPYEKVVTEVKNDEMVELFSAITASFKASNQDSANYNHPSSSATSTQAHQLRRGNSHEFQGIYSDK